MTVTLVNYSHSGSGQISLSLKNTTYRRAPERLRGIISRGPQPTVTARLNSTVFQGSILSVVSKKKCTHFTVHTGAKRSLVMKLFDLVGETNISFKIGENAEKSKGSYLTREEYLHLRKSVEDLLVSLAEMTGESKEDLLLRISSEEGKVGVKTLFKMKVARLKELQEHLTILIQEHEKERAV